MCGFQPYFQAFVFREDVSRPKPDPEPYLKAAALLGARKPLVVEDSDAGIEAGKAAGFDTLRVDNPGRMPELVRDRLIRGR
jgi:HAD superfamily hydrolase (TIGR01509 family)